MLAGSQDWYLQEGKDDDSGRLEILGALSACEKNAVFHFCRLVMFVKSCKNVFEEMMY